MIFDGLCVKQIPAGQADNARPDALCLQFLTRRKRQLNLGTGGNQGDVGRRVSGCMFKHIAAGADAERKSAGISANRGSVNSAG